MPLDSSMNDYDSFYERADWYYKFAWLPKRCVFSKKRIWLKRAYMAVRMYTGPGEPIFEYRWAERNQFLVQRLKGRI